MELQASAFAVGATFSGDRSGQVLSIYPGFWGELESGEVTPKDWDLGSSGFSSWCCSQFSASLG